MVSLIPLVVVRQTERGLLERFGKFKKYLEPGVHFIIPFVDDVFQINITEQMVDSEKQSVITEDNLNVTISTQIYFRVKADEENVRRSEYNVNNYVAQIVSLSKTCLRSVIGQYKFEIVNNSRDKLNNELAKQLEKNVSVWGIEIVRAEIKEIDPPQDVQDTMNSVMKAQNEKRAAVDFATAAETKADGAKRAAIRAAEGNAQAVILEAKAKADAIKVVNEASDKYFVGNAKEYEKLQVARDVFRDNTKIIMPSDSPITELLSGLVALKTVEETTKNKKAKE